MLPRSGRRSRERGFTLVEMMVVVAIISILSALIISVNSRTYGASAANVSDQINSALGMAKMRAVSTRRIQEVEIKPQEIRIWQSTTTGFVTPVSYAFVERIVIPSGVTIWDVRATLYPNPGSLTPTKNTSLDYMMLFKPDGSSTGGTTFVTDAQNVKTWRVITYRATGSSYARETW